MRRPHDLRQYPRIDPSNFTKGAECIELGRRAALGRTDIRRELSARRAIGR